MKNRFDCFAITILMLVFISSECLLDAQSIEGEKYLEFQQVKNGDPDDAFSRSMRNHELAIKLGMKGNASEKYLALAHILNHAPELVMERNLPIKDWLKVAAKAKVGRAQHWLKSLEEGHQEYRKLQEFNENLFGELKCLKFGALGVQLVAAGKNDNTQVWRKTKNANKFEFWIRQRPRSGIGEQLPTGSFGKVLISRDGIVALGFSQTNPGCLIEIAPKDMFTLNIEKRKQRFAASTHVATIAGTVTQDGQLIATSCGHFDGRKDWVWIYDNHQFQGKPWVSKKTKLIGGHTGIVNCLAFSNNNRLLATASWDGTIRIWDTENWKSIRTIKVPTVRVKDLKFRPDDQSLLTTTYAGIYEFNANDGKQIKFLSAPKATCMDISGDGKQFAIGQSDGLVRVFNHDDYSERFRLNAMTHIHSLAFSPTEKILASGGESKIVLWDIR